MDGRYVRGRAFNLSLLATAYAAQDEPEQASVVGRQALDLTVRLTSARSVRYVRDRSVRLGIGGHELWIAGNVGPLF